MADACGYEEMGKAGSNRGGADFRSLLDRVIDRERDFRKELRKSGGGWVPFKQSPEILKCIFDEADNRRRLLRQSIKKEDRCNRLHAPPPTEFPHSGQPEAPPHAMVGKATPSLQQQQSHQVDDLPPSNRNVVVQYHTRHCFPNQNTSKSSMHMPLPDYLENHMEVERRYKLGYHSYDDPGELPIPPMVKEGLPLRSTFIDKRTESMAIENLSVEIEQLCNDQSSSSLHAVELCCHVCRVHCLTAFNLQEHFQGKKHLMKCKEYEQRPPAYKQLGALRCDICSLTFSNICSLHQHFQDREHLRRCEVYDRKPRSSPQPADFYCDICHVSCTSMRNLRQHCEGKSHISKREELSCGRENKSVWCDLCCIPCPNMMSLIQHRAGKKHIMMSLGLSYREASEVGLEIGTGESARREMVENKHKRTE